MLYIQPLVIFSSKDWAPACPEVSGYLKPITALHSCYRFQNVSGIMSNSMENGLHPSNNAAMTSLPSIFPGCQHTPPLREGLYKFNLVVHSRIEQRDGSVVTLGMTSSQPCQYWAVEHKLLLDCPHQREAGRSGGVPTGLDPVAHRTHRRGNKFLNSQHVRAC